jgi:hypothetical protein
MAIWVRLGDTRLPDLTLGHLAERPQIPPTGA